MFILNNRNRYFTDFSNSNNNHDMKYDIVIGAVADDDIALQFRLFSSGIIDVETLVKGMEYRKLSGQYSFHTPKAVAFLNRTGAKKYE